jgi:hypothetical protein
VLKEYDLWELVEKLVVLSTYLITLEAHEKKEIKADRVVLDSVKHPLIPHLSEKRMTKEMFDSLVGLFQSTNMNRNMVLINRLVSVHKPRYDNTTIYLMRITQVCDQIATIGAKIEDVELMNVAFNGLPKSRNHFSNYFALERNSHFCRGFGMITSRKRLGRSLKKKSRDMKRRRS